MKRKDLTPDMIVFVAENRDYMDRDGRKDGYGEAKVIAPAVETYRSYGNNREFKIIEPDGYGYAKAKVLVEIAEGWSGEPVQVAMPLSQILGPYETVAAEIKAHRDAVARIDHNRRVKHETDGQRASGLATELHALLNEAGGPLAFSSDAIRARGLYNVSDAKHLTLSLDAAARIVELLDEHSNCPLTPGEVTEDADGKVHYNPQH